MKLDIKIQVPQKLQRFLKNPTPYISSVIKAADKDALTLLKREISAAAPKKSGKLAGSITVDLASRKLFSLLNYARAVELGHFASAKYTPRRMFLKFTDMGKEVFLRYVRTKKQPFFFKALDRNRTKVIDIYEKAFKRLLEKL